ncbi:MAG: hypothetical protein KBC12_02035 [Candidatus Pacebacteria bacterium]|jgi:hypothetical protein|nr:hypothetical protein [Candidatus Paceibacterota bacterium]MBP9851201.1 hypothetical protein [Candidatus Paceibacterota bacterium]
MAKKNQIDSKTQEQIDALRQVFEALIYVPLDVLDDKVEDIKEENKKKEQNKKKSFWEDFDD